MAHYEFSFIDQVEKQESAHICSETFEFTDGQSWGYPVYTEREELEKSKHLKDDCFTIRCDVIVKEGSNTTGGTGSSDVASPFVVDGADVTFEVSGEKFFAHRCMLAARSTMFKAELFGPMKEGTLKNAIQIMDMEPEIFKALLSFIYSDSPPVMEEDEDVDMMWQHLLVAADWYNLQRLKLICEEKFCGYIGGSKVTTILTLAEQHHCHGLKEACLEFLSSPTNLELGRSGDDFENLATTCPSVVKKLVAKLALLRLSSSWSAISAGDTSGGYYLLVVEGYSRSKDAFPKGTCVRSRPFIVGGYRWVIRYFPNGDHLNAGSSSLYVGLDKDVAQTVKAKYEISFINEVEKKEPARVGAKEKYNFSTNFGSSYGYPNFIKKEALEISEHLKNDSFTIRCDIIVVQDDGNTVQTTAAAAPFPAVSPSDMPCPGISPISSWEGTDVTFDVGGETFAAHRCVLAARSTVFKVELFGPMKEGTTTNVIKIRDMEPHAFKAMLWFIYSDSSPEMGQDEDEDDDEEDVLWQHLLVAADRYNLPRLKQICQEKLCGYTGPRTATTIVALADRHNCRGLREACLEFLISPANLEEVMEGNGFDDLVTSCPSVVKELFCQACVAQRPRSASAIVADTVTCYHLLKIDGYSITKAVYPNGEYFVSRPFTAAGYSWNIRYYPNGHTSNSADYISFFLYLNQDDANEVKAQHRFSLYNEDDDDEPEPPSLTSSHVKSFFSNSGWGPNKFMTRKELEKSEHLKNDSFTVRCDIIVTNVRSEDTPSKKISVAVPPSDLHQNLGISSLRRRALMWCLRLMEGATTDVICIDDIEAQVFKDMLSFVYTNSLPEMKEEEDVMCQHLLVAADRYGMGRLKLLCEDKLCKYIDVGTVVSVLILAEQHNCEGLKMACFEFLSTPTNLKAAMANTGFVHLTRSCPSLMTELIAMLYWRMMAWRKLGEPARLFSWMSLRSLLCSDRSAMASTAGGGQQSRSASTIVADAASGYHVLKIDGYSRTKGMPTGEFLKSCAFTVGGHRWRIHYYPNGQKSDYADFISLFLHLDDKEVTKEVKAQNKFRLLEEEFDDKPPPSLAAEKVHVFRKSGWGEYEFIKREVLEKSENLKNDSFTVRCDIIVTTEFRSEVTPEAINPRKANFVSVPPSDLHLHLRDLLYAEKGVDLVFEAGGETFAAHRCVLAARSPVFSAELFGSMKESDATGVIRIDDMEAEVFRALLHFMYTDSLSEMKKKDEDVMCQHLLVAADRYDMERLKLMCEDKLCKCIGVGSVANILTLAEQHHCEGLKKACFEFLSCPANVKAVAAGDGFEHLCRSCPSLMNELISKLGI
uniref:BTB domain-containing protein n=1 Tax=Leersia perrieri TaxID=77586 RepID=A0A0D9XJW6_9ORYZ